jgi:hypothetical protein
MAQPLKAGPGGEYASEVLYDIFGDDTLFDEIGDLGDRDPEADVRDLIRARAQELEVVMPEEAAEVDVEVGESIVENPTEEEPASEYQAGQARAAKGKADSLGMNMGGDDAAAIKTAGGDDIEENYQGGGDKVMFKGREIDTDTIDYDMEDFSDLIFNIDYGVKYTDGSPVDEADYEALTYTDDIMDFVRIDYVESFREGVDNFVNPNDQDGTDDANKISNSEQSDLDSEDMTENEEMEDLLRLAGRGNVNEAKSPPEVINPTKDSSPADLKAAMKYAKYMKAKMDTDKAKATYDKEIAQLEGWMKAKSVTKETQDIDTGKEALKAEREPMLERILQLSKW